MRDVFREAVRVRGVVPAGLICIAGAVALAPFEPLLSAGALALGFLVVTYGIIRRAPAIQPQPAATAHEDTAIPVASGSEDQGDNEPPANVDQLDWIIFKNLKHSDDPRPLGRTGRYSARYFVDLREACLVPSQRNILADAVAEHIRGHINVEHFHVLATPKSGNALLGVAVAERLNLAPLLVRDWPIYGRSVESIENAGRAILFDDVWAEGDVLVDVVNRVREAGFIVAHAVLLIERAEGDVSARLHAAAISHFLAIRVMSDSDLAALITKVRRA